MSTAHRQNLMDVLAREIGAAKEQGEQASPRQAVNRVTARWLNYELEEEKFVDGAGDRGIDFWFQSPTGFDIFQTKHHELHDEKLDLSRFDQHAIADLHRVKDFLLSGKAPSAQNKQLLGFYESFESAVAAKKFGKDTEPLSINLELVLLSDGLTLPAETEFRAFCQSIEKPFPLDSVQIQFRANYYTIDDLVQQRWRLDNRQWQDMTGTKRETIDFRPEKWDEALVEHHSAVFYSHAQDLVRAYQDFGYQIFEPNVRCNITRSEVNDAIRGSVMGYQSREQFRFLNNGVTIVCSGYNKPTQNRPAFRVSRPGVVNGLQTVVALSDAYRQLKMEEKEHFEKNCFVLVRLLTEKAFPDLNRLVRATNTQNPMQPRNLFSNNHEQILFERLFAELGWFYERKQGAWEAFDTDPRRWRSLPNKRPSHFQYKQGAGRPRTRRLDNEVLGQTWLSFVGFSEEAVHNRREIFGNQEWYDFVFLRTPTKHGSEFEFRVSEAREEAVNQAPNPNLMLVSYLVREFARAAAPTARENQEAAYKRLNINPNKLSKEELSKILADDPQYVLGQILNGMSFVFTEYMGFILYQSHKNGWLNSGKRMIENGSLARLRTESDFDGVAKDVNDQKFSTDDVLAVAWWSFRHILEGLVGSPWLASYRLARNRTRFNHSAENRLKIFNEANQLHRYTERTELTRTWAIGIKPGTGLYGFFKASLQD